MFARVLIRLVVWVAVVSGGNFADELYWDIPLADVEWSSEASPDRISSVDQVARDAFSGVVSVRVVLDFGGVGYILMEDTGPARLVAQVKLDSASRSLASFRGTLFRERSRTDGARLDFTLDASAANPAARGAFEAGRGTHHRAMVSNRVPGSAWFRHQAGKYALDLDSRERLEVNFRASSAELHESFALFTGGRALAENMQLDRLFLNVQNDGAGAEPAVYTPIESIEGIRVPEFDWEPLLEGVPLLDADKLLARIPNDQHVVLMPSFAAFARLADELAERASPLVAVLESSSTSAGSRETLEEQLGLSLNNLARLLGPALIKRVAVTGGDPYARLGTDVTILFECRDADTVVAHLRAAHAAARSKPGVVSVAGDASSITVEGASSIEGVADPMRRVSSYFAAVEDIVVVSNSRRSLERILSVSESSSLLDLDETDFFRHRYPAGENETAFLLVSDAALRRWCGPKWRIGASRRLRALARILDIQAAHVGELAVGLDESRVLVEMGEKHPELGVVTLTREGVHSSVFGSAGRMTPILEMEIESVPAEEVREYERWRNGYSNNWTAGFDPIGGRFLLDDKTFEADITVLPLIGRTDYREMRDWSGDAALGPLDGDPHAGALLQFALAIDPKSPNVKEIHGSIAGLAPESVSNVMRWMTGSFAFFIDDGDVWDTVLEAEDPDEVWEDLFVDFNDLPMAFSMGSSNPLKLAAWLSALRGFVDGAAPGLSMWRTLVTDKDEPYVRVGAGGANDDDIHILYAALREALVVSSRAETLFETMERYRKRREAQDGPTPNQGASFGVETGWLGESAAFRVSRRGIAVLSSLGEFSDSMQGPTYANLPILNEWRRLFPDADPVDVHRRVFGQELRCAGGGTFVWNEEWKTMESSILGHPGDRRSAKGTLPSIGDLELLEAGLTFEHDGLRARVRATH